MTPPPTPKEANLKEVMANLKSAGSEQTRKVYLRHGVKEPLYGVSYAHLKGLKKQLKTNHPLAKGLWATKNHDARVLACFVADPNQMNKKLIEAWSSDLSNYVLTDALAGLVAKSKHSETYLNKWVDSTNEWTGRAGWLLLCQQAMNDETKEESYFEERLRSIEKGIHSRPNRTKDAMNSALIAIGMRGGTLETTALATADKVGTVDVDHGETGCKTPDARAYILKANARKQSTGKGLRQKRQPGCS